MSTGTALTLAALGAGGILLLHTQGKGSQAIENLVQQAIDLIEAAESKSDGVSKTPNPMGTENDGATTKPTYKVGQKATPAETYTLPADSLFRGGSEPLRVVHVDKYGTPFWSTLPQSQVEAWLAQFK